MCDICANYYGCQHNDQQLYECERRLVRKPATGKDLKMVLLTRYSARMEKAVSLSTTIVIQKRFVVGARPTSTSMVIDRCIGISKVVVSSFIHVKMYTVGGC